MFIGLPGGTGTERKGLALRFAAAGAEVVIGSRSREVRVIHKISPERVNTMG